MTSKQETEPAQGFEIESASRIWLKKYLKIPNNRLRLLALDYSIKTIINEGTRAELQSREMVSDAEMATLCNSEKTNEINIHNHRNSPEYGAGFFKLYVASLFLIQRYAEKMIEQNQTPRADAFTKTGNAFRHQKEIVLAELTKPASDPDLV